MIFSSSYYGRLTFIFVNDSEYESKDDNEELYTSVVIFDTNSGEIKAEDTTKKKHALSRNREFMVEVNEYDEKTKKNFLKIIFRF